MGYCNHYFFPYLTVDIYTITQVVISFFCLENYVMVTLPMVSSHYMLIIIYYHRW